MKFILSLAFALSSFVTIAGPVKYNICTVKSGLITKINAVKVADCTYDGRKLFDSNGQNLFYVKAGSEVTCNNEEKLIQNCKTNNLVKMKTSIKLNELENNSLVPLSFY